MSSPTPDGNAGPSPLTVGKRFVKQYYEVLSNSPDQIFRFYQSSSNLSHAEGSDPTDSSPFDSYGIAERWGSASKKRIELENGAIDAQPSIHGSILLVVTGHVVFADNGKEDRKAFVHTFFLTLVPNTKRFYVHNDVLRFLNKQAETPGENKEEEVTETEEETKPIKEPDVAEPSVVEPVADVAPGGGVEETKEAAPDDDDSSKEKVDGDKPGDIAEDTAASVEETKEEPAADPRKEKENMAKEHNTHQGSGKSKKKGRGRSPPSGQKQQPAPKPVPGSWASLVASGGGSSAVAVAAAPSPTKPPAPEKPEPTVEKKSQTGNAKPQQEKESKDNSSGNQGRQNRGDRPKRDPDCTVVIKNLPDNTKEADLVALFEQFATKTNSKIVGTTVSAHRSIAFVDYNAVAPVMAAIERQSKEPFQLNGRTLEIDQKTAEQRARRNMRGGYRSGSPGNGGMYRGGGGGRHNQYRRGGGGRGDRGGGRGGRGGR